MNKDRRNVILFVCFVGGGVFLEAIIVIQVRNNGGVIWHGGPRNDSMLSGLVRWKDEVAISRDEEVLWKSRPVVYFLICEA